MQPHFFIKQDGRYFRIAFRDIDLIEGCRNYVKIYTGDKSYIVLMTMKKMEQTLPISQFHRIHKSYIVALDSIQSFDKETVYLLNGREIPLGQQYKLVFIRSQLILGSQDTDPMNGHESFTVSMESPPAVYLSLKR
ncbi:MAG: LytR/AlgR family response regulator transcription factor [Chitinophagaceae bacterium]